MVVLYSPICRFKAVSCPSWFEQPGHKAMADLSYQTDLIARGGTYNLRSGLFRMGA
jgi:hypothetical protein